jgi:integrase
MPFKRSGRTTWTFQARTETGYKQLGTRTANKSLATQMETMWERLANDYRAWDVLGLVLQGQLEIGRLHDYWVRSRYNVLQVRQLLLDIDLASLVPDWYAVQSKTGRVDSARHALRHVLELFGGGTYAEVDGDPCIVVRGELLASLVTTELLTKRLYAQQHKQNTLRKIHSSWSVFFAYCADVKGLFPSNPMDAVKRPAQERPPIQFFEMEAVELIVGSQPDLMRRALFALLYSTGLEISTSLSTRTTDVQLEAKRIRGPGTKAHSRDRVARVADWAWPIVEEYVRSLQPGALMFPKLDRQQATKWHAETVSDLALPHVPMKNARHHWAVRMIRSGAPVRIVQDQLGHSTPLLTLSIYGRFRPTEVEMDEWEQTATARDDRRRQAHA